MPKICSVICGSPEGRLNERPEGLIFTRLYLFKLYS